MKTFKDIPAFLAELAALQRRAPQIQSEALRNAGQIVQAEARSYLGQYQPAGGPFVEWAELSDFTKRERERLGYEPNQPGLMTGALREHIDLSYDAQRAAVGVPHETVGSGFEGDETRDVGAVAILFEQGDAKQPPRSFLGRALHATQDLAAKEIAKTITDRLAGHAGHARAEADHADVPF